jgi:hypothetical protein
MMQFRVFADIISTFVEMVKRYLYICRDKASQEACRSFPGEEDGRRQRSRDGVRADLKTG